MVADRSQDERLIETIMKARDAQRRAANRFRSIAILCICCNLFCRLWWSYLTGADMEPKHNYTGIRAVYAIIA